MFDTFYDRRNSVNFVTNALGARQDGQVTNERQWNGDWNTVWEVRAGRFEGGWTVEIAVPFKSLRYRPGRAQVWGFNAFRTNRWKNEISYVTRVPAARGQSALYQGSVEATVVGLEVPSGSRNLELKPYAISDVTTNRAAAVRNDVSGDVGLDVKYGLTQNLMADFTYNTDFAQVEADEQQVNLTRFSVFFPEKRDFFLENQGLFAFGGAAAGGFSAQNSDVPILFYSRRVGLNDGQPVPIIAGGRTTGRVGRYSLGLVDMQTGDERGRLQGAPAMAGIDCHHLRFRYSIRQPLLPLNTKGPILHRHHNRCGHVDLAGPCRRIEPDNFGDRARDASRRCRAELA